MAGNAIDELVNNLYELVQDAWSMPLGGDRCVIDREKVLDLLDEIRANFPSDLKMARDIVERRNDLLGSAKKESESVRKQAEEYAKQLVNEHEIVTTARKKAADIIATAEARAKQVMQAAGEYCDDAMKRTEDLIAQTLDEVKSQRAQFRNALKEQQ